MRDPIRCENVDCPDPGEHGHTLDSRDDLDSARWDGYWPIAPEIVADTAALVSPGYRDPSPLD